MKCGDCGQEFPGESLLAFHRDRVHPEAITAVELDRRVANVLQSARKAEREAWAGDIVWGLVWAGGGGAITLATYLMARSGSGTYWVTSGAFVYGGFRLIRGLFRLTSNRAIEEAADSEEPAYVEDISDRLNAARGESNFRPPGI